MSQCSLENNIRRLRTECSGQTISVDATRASCRSGYWTENPLAALRTHQANPAVRVNVNPCFWSQFDSSLRPNLGRSRVAPKGSNLSFTESHNDLRFPAPKWAQLTNQYGSR